MSFHRLARRTTVNNSLEIDKAKKHISIIMISFGSGGAEKTVSLLLPRLIENFQVSLIIFNNDIHFNIPKAVNLIILNKKTKLSFFEKIFLFPKLLFKYNSIINKKEIEVSISFLTRPNLLNGLIKILNPKLKVILSERCFPTMAYKSNILRYYLYKILIPLLYNKADLIFSNSNHINDDLKDNFGVRKTLVTIYNPIEIPANYKKNTKRKNDFKIINVGSIYPIKNQILLVKAIQKTLFESKVFFLGDGIDRIKIQEYVKSINQTDRFNFAGKVKNVNQYLLESDCFVLTSNSEGFPNALLEAMAVGLPVIATNCKSGPLEILNNNNFIEISIGKFYKAKYGMLINVDDDLALAKALTYLFNNPDYCDTLSIQSRIRAKHFDSLKAYYQLKEIIDL